MGKKAHSKISRLELKNPQKEESMRARIVLGTVSILLLVTVIVLSVVLANVNGDHSTTTAQLGETQAELVVTKALGLLALKSFYNHDLYGPIHKNQKYQRVWRALQDIDASASIEYLLPETGQEGVLRIPWAGDSLGLCGPDRCATVSFFNEDGYSSGWTTKSAEVPLKTLLQ